MSKPIRVFYSELGHRLYATRAYREIKPGIFAVTGEKFDVTDDIGEIVVKHNIVFSVDNEQQTAKA